MLLQLHKLGILLFLLIVLIKCLFCSLVKKNLFLAIYKTLENLSRIVKLNFIRHTFAEISSAETALKLCCLFYIHLISGRSFISVGICLFIRLNKECIFALILHQNICRHQFRSPSPFINLNAVASDQGKTQVLVR